MEFLFDGYQVISKEEDSDVLFFCYEKDAKVSLSKMKEFFDNGCMRTIVGISKEQPLIMKQDNAYIYIGCLKCEISNFKRLYVQFLKSKKAK